MSRMDPEELRPVKAVEAELSSLNGDPVRVAAQEAVAGEQPGAGAEGTLRGVEPSQVVVLATRAGDRNRLVTAFRKHAEARLRTYESHHAPAPGARGFEGEET